MKSPFKFLDSYTKDDRAIFFGRDREIEELYHRVFESKIMLVYGVSGTGKSSLIHCGLANKFQDTDWLPIVIRRGGNIIENMAAGIRSASLTDQQNKFSTPSDFKKGVRSLYLDHYKPVFFIFDQFEELFIFGDKEERRTFIHIVKILTESELQCRMIFVMREEYMAGVTEFEKFIPTFFSNRVRIEKMSHLNALEAIKQPCIVFNISLEEGFSESLLEKLSPGETDVELTYLQVFLDKIYRLAVGFVPPPGGEFKGGYSPTPESKGGSVRSRGGSPTPTPTPTPTLTLNFTLPLLSRTGNVSDLLGSFLEEQLKALDEPDTGLSILKSFVSLRGTKKQLTAQEVIDSSRAFGKDIPSDKVADLLLKFVNLRILRDKDENGKYELRHDSLAAKIYEKITLVEKELMEINQFLENALLSWQKRNVMLSANDLKYLAPYEDRLFVNKEIGNLIELSRKEFNKGKKRIKRAAIAGFVAILIISFAAIMRINHWPLSGMVRNFGFLIYILWFLPLFIFYTIKTKENRVINFMFLLFTLFFLGYNYIYLRTIQTGARDLMRRPMNQTAKQFYLMIDDFNKKADSIYNLIYLKSNQSPADSNDFIKIADDLKSRTSELDNYIQDLKIELVRYTEQPKPVPYIINNRIDISAIRRIDDTNIPSQILIGSAADGKAFPLRAMLNDYKSFLKEISDNDASITAKMDKLLELNNWYDKERDEYEKWEFYTFQATSLGFTLITLTQYQQDIRYLESEVAMYLYNKINSELDHAR